MVKHNRTEFQIKKNQPLGDKLVWRNPGASQEIVRQLAIAGIDPAPGQITVGYYRTLDDPPGAPAFMPINSAAAIAALDIDIVRDRIAEDLIIRLRAES